MNRNYFPTDFPFTHHRLTLERSSRRGISRRGFWTTEKVNYLIPVSVSKYLCHSLMSSKNFNDGGTQKLIFVFVASRREVALVNEQQRVSRLSNISRESRKNGFHYFIQFLKILIVYNNH